jgi:hypothetical protein
MRRIGKRGRSLFSETFKRTKDYIFNALPSLSTLGVVNDHKNFFPYYYGSNVNAEKPQILLVVVASSTTTTTYI